PSSAAAAVKFDRRAAASKLRSQSSGAWDRQLFQSLGFWRHWPKNSNLNYAFGKDSMQSILRRRPKTGFQKHADESNP
ncbi:hypothetical protein, partial [Mesorhizobium sp.]|uniref:hypothetical protein n=1 Tax=Mesorhizobium sp. TaxID=1871066 RepID=UPI0025BB9294